MSLILTPLYTDNFTPNANPLNPAHWTALTDTTIYATAEAHSGLFEQTNNAFNNDLISSENFTGVSIPNDQYVTITFGQWIVGNGQEAGIVLRNSTSGDSSYELDFSDNGDGVTCEVSLAAYVANAPILPFLYDNFQIVSKNDVWTLAIIGYTLYVYQNGTLIFSGKDPNSTYASGYPGLYMIGSTTRGDGGFGPFVTGSAAGSLGGPITSGTVYPGPVFGSSLSTAFPNNRLDIFQVVNEGGEVVWNLDYSGVATVNPMSPTSGTVLGQFSGASFSAAFPNPYQLNVFQVVSQGGAVVFHVDYQGNAVTP